MQNTTEALNLDARELIAKVILSIYNIIFIS
jgi:hypothetical protein